MRVCGGGGLCNGWFAAGTGEGPICCPFQPKNHPTSLCPLPGQVGKAKAHPPVCGADEKPKIDVSLITQQWADLHEDMKAMKEAKESPCRDDCWDELRDDNSQQPKASPPALSREQEEMMERYAEERALQAVVGGQYKVKEQLEAEEAAEQARREEARYN